MKQFGCFLTLVYHLFYKLERYLLFSIHQKTNIFSIQDFKVISKSFQIGTPQILSIRILIISWPRAFVMMKVSSYFGISLLLNEIGQRNFSFLFKNVEGSLLELFMKEHCLAKELNRSALSLKSVPYWFSWLKGGIFLLFQNVFKVDQLGFCTGHWICQLIWWTGVVLLFITLIMEFSRFWRHLTWSDNLWSPLSLTYFFIHLISYRFCWDHKEIDQLLF